jgi:hypothetical protein
LDDIYASRLHIDDVIGNFPSGGGSHTNPISNVDDTYYPVVGTVTNPSVGDSSTYRFGYDDNNNPVYPPSYTQHSTLTGGTGGWSRIVGLPTADEILRQMGLGGGSATGGIRIVGTPSAPTGTTGNSSIPYDGGDELEYLKQRLHEIINNPIGEAAILGNFMKESRLRPDNLQDSYENSRFDDASYTEWANNNRDAFIKDGKGFGYAQWTNEERKRDFVNICDIVDVERAVYEESAEGVEASLVIKYNGEYTKVKAKGNGRLDAVSNALRAITGIDYVFDSYTEHDLEGKSSSKAASYVSIKYNGKAYWGTGVDSDIIVSSVKALISAVNIMLKNVKK